MEDLADGASASPATQRVWQAHPSPYGVPFYYNPATKESRWTIPTGPLDRIIPAGKMEMKEAPKEAEKKQGDEGEEGAGQLEHADTAETAEAGEVCSLSSSSSSDESHPEGMQTLTAQERAHLKVEEFTKMLQEKKLTTSDRFESWLPRLTADPRFTAVPKSQRKPLFQKILHKMTSEKRHVDAAARRHNRTALEELLKTAEANGLLDKVQASEEAIAKISASNLGQDACWQNAPLAERAHMVEAAVATLMQKRTAAGQLALREFRTLLQEKIFQPPDDSTELPSFEDVKQRLRHELRWKSLASKTLRQQVYNQMWQECSSRLAASRKAKADEEDDAKFAVLSLCRLDVLFV